MKREDLHQLLEDSAYERPFLYDGSDGIDASRATGGPEPVARIFGLYSRRHRNAALITVAVNLLPSMLRVVEAADRAHDRADPGACATCRALIACDEAMAALP